MSVKRLLSQLIIGVAGLAIGLPSIAQDAASEGTAAANAVISTWGTPSTLNSGLAQPLNSSTPMSTVDGSSTFSAQTACPATTHFLQLVMFPDSTGDIAQLGVSEDLNFDGSYDTNALFVGPYAGICANGLIHCDPGTFTDCSYWEWTGATTGVSLTQTSQASLGACFCINNACGSNLAFTNSATVLSTMGYGIAHAMNTVYPRLTIASSSSPDPTTAVFYGSMSGCGSSTDPQPEQYYNNPAGLQTAGVADATAPGSSYAMVLSSPAAQGQGGISSQSCSRTRAFNVVDVNKNQVIALLSQTHGNVSDCGTGCLKVQLGTNGNDYWAGGACSVFTDKESIQINGAQYITSATLIDAEFDDYQQILVNGNLIYADPASWTTPGVVPMASCETGRHNSVDPNIDVTAFFATNGVVNVQNNTAVGGNGEGWSIIQFAVQDGCSIESSYIDDGCTAEEANPSCSVQNEVVDGVTTVNNGVATGLEPIPSSQTVAGSSCSVPNVQEPWWVDQRTYTCTSATATTYDMTEAEERQKSINTTLNPTTGSYTDLTFTATGQPIPASAAIPLPPTEAVPACFPTCETEAAAIGEPVGSPSGVQQTLNSSGLPVVYTWKQCTGTNYDQCPLNTGETLAQSCACHSSFGQAASTMQLIRMTQQDTICTTGN